MRILTMSIGILNMRMCGLFASIPHTIAPLVVSAVSVCLSLARRRVVVGLAGCWLVVPSSPPPTISQVFGMNYGLWIIAIQSDSDQYYHRHEYVHHQYGCVEQVHRFTGSADGDTMTMIHIYNCTYSSTSTCWLSHMRIHIRLMPYTPHPRVEAFYCGQRVTCSADRATDSSLVMQDVSATDKRKTITHDGHHDPYCVHSGISYSHTSPHVMW
jgi:hypothetical protein